MTTGNSDDDERAFRWVMAAFASIRVANGVSPQALADQAGITLAELQRIESGSSDVRCSSVHHYIRALGGKMTFEIVDGEINFEVGDTNGMH
jgi:predicted transcriptional regulator